MHLATDLNRGSDIRSLSHSSSSQYFPTLYGSLKRIHTFKNIHWKEIKASSIVRTLLTIVVIINYILSILGKNPLPITENQITTIVFSIFTIVIIIIGFWKNNAFTSQAQIGQDVIDKLKSGKTLGEIIDELSKKPNE